MLECRHELKIRLVPRVLIAACVFLIWLGLAAATHTNYLIVHLVGAAVTAASLAVLSERLRSRTTN